MKTPTAGPPRCGARCEPASVLEPRRPDLRAAQAALASHALRRLDRMADQRGARAVGREEREVDVQVARQALQRRLLLGGRSAGRRQDVARDRAERFSAPPRLGEAAPRQACD
jgi:predicted alpha/beta-hydrolase family hydrolase